MKSILRWIAVLPGAVVAMIVVNIINGFTVAVIFPEIVDEVCKAWFGSLAFVLAAYYIAPVGKAVTAIVVATTYCAIGLFAMVLDIRSGQPHHPAWFQITTALISVTASVLACALVYSFERDKGTGPQLN
jgi:hypothetical protein